MWKKIIRWIVIILVSFILAFIISYQYVMYLNNPDFWDDSLITDHIKIIAEIMRNPILTWRML